MKLCIQIPCYNESKTLPGVLKDIPAAISGISQIKIVVIDDGSKDDTSEVAAAHGVKHVVRNLRNLGLAHSFRRGLDACLALDADIIVNMDGDHQYRGGDIPRLIEPILKGQADIVIGNRQTDKIEHFPLQKKLLQKLGTWVVRKLSRTQTLDATSGFRAFSRAAALKLTVLSNYTYTLETILQVEAKGLTLANVTIDTNLPTRPSRLIKTLRAYLVFSVATMIRVFTMYNPLKLFLYCGTPLVAIGVILGLRFGYFYLTSSGTGHLQSLIVATLSFIAGLTLILAGILTDLIQFNRRLLEDVLERVRRLESTRHSRGDQA